MNYAQSLLYTPVLYQCIFSLDIFISFSELGYFTLCEATILPSCQLVGAGGLG